MGASWGCCIDEDPMIAKRNMDPKLLLDQEVVSEISANIRQSIRNRTPKAQFAEQESASSNTYTLPINKIIDYSLTEPHRKPDAPQPDTPTDSKPNVEHSNDAETKPHNKLTETEQTQPIEMETDHESDDVNDDKQEPMDTDPKDITPAPNDVAPSSEPDDTETDTKSEELITNCVESEVTEEITQNHEEVHIEKKEEEEQDIASVVKDDDEDKETQIEETTPPKPDNEEPEKEESPIETKEEEEVEIIEKKENETARVSKADQQFLTVLMDDTADEEEIKVPDEDQNVVTLPLYTKESEVKEQEEKPAPNGLLLQKYKSQRQMLDDECIKVLLNMKLKDDISEVLGDRSSYILPLDDKDALFHLERDLRKIKFAFKNISVSGSRKHAKIAILKHYTILNAMYVKYCKIGGDEHWLNYDGYIALLRDVGIITIDHSNDRYIEIFHSLFDYHSKHSHRASTKGSKSKHSAQLSAMYGGHSFHDSDPWTGIWCLVRDKQRIHRMEKEKRQREETEAKRLKKIKLNNKSKSYQKKARRKLSIKEKSEQYFKKYKLRKIGDKRIIGCMNSIDHAELGGTFEKNNYTKATMEIKFKKRRIKVHNQHRVWKCVLIPPESVIDDITMKVKWEEINEGAAKNKKGNIKLYKHDELVDDDVDIPKSQSVGLARSEFFDAMLCCSRVLHQEQKDEGVPFIGGFLGRIDDEKAEENMTDDLYKKFDVLVNEYIDEYIYKNHCELERYIEDEEVKDKLRGCNTVLMKLFKKYADLDNSEFTTKQNQEIDCDEWSAMALDLCKAARSFDKNIWKLGGKPSRTEIIQCFTLCKNETLLHHDEISFGQFQRCLIIFTNCIFKYHPKARYNVVEFHTKLDLLLKWCEKLEAQKIRISSASYMRSDTLKRIKRERQQSMHQNVFSTQSAYSSRALVPDSLASLVPDLANQTMNHSM